MTADRIWRRVDRSGEHWIISGALNTYGYGAVRWHDRSELAHRWAYEQASGEPIPAGMCVCHTYDIRNCVRNDGPLTTYTVNGIDYPCYGHLFLADNDANMADGVRKGRFALGDRNVMRSHPDLVPRGEVTWNARLTDDLVRYIRASPISAYRLAKMLGVSKPTVLRVRRGTTWRHVV